MEIITNNDMKLLEKEIERIKNDPEAQKRIADKLQSTLDYLDDLNKKRRITPESWSKQVTF